MKERIKKPLSENAQATTDEMVWTVPDLKTWMDGNLKNEDER